MESMTPRLLALCAFLSGCGGVSVTFATVELPSLFSDHMVVQADTPIAIWGWATPAEAVTITLAGKAAQGTADASGKWSAILPPIAATSAAQTLVVRGTNTVIIDDVLVGEVWLCSGQSNMEMQVKGLHGQVDHADAEIAAAKFPSIRMFQFDETYDIYQVAVPPGEPQARRPGSWIICSPETVAKFTAIGYFFGREIHQALHAPVGLVHVSVGGTPIEAWTSAEAQAAVPALQPLLRSWEAHLQGYDPVAALKENQEARKRWKEVPAAAKAKGTPAPKAPAAFKNAAVSTPASLYNGLIAPIIPYTIRGVVWYQGERNAAGPFTSLYGLQLKTLIADWRARWGTELYFDYVQIANFGKVQQLPSEPKGWGVSVREGEWRATSVPNTGMAVGIDLGGVTAGHPTHKQALAHRLALHALHDVYRQPISVWSGPLFAGMQVSGDEVILAFDHADGLAAKTGELRGFAIAGPDRKFVWAEAKIEGNAVRVRNAHIKDPVAVRYDWAANPIGNLVNSAGLPASPFRTDEW